MKKEAFTLLELLVVVGIIGVLAVIALPNFSNAWIKANLAKVQSDFNAISIAIEMYFADHGDFPIFTTIRNQDYFCNNDKMLAQFTTPVSYLSPGSFIDPFRSKRNVEKNITGNALLYDYNRCWQVKFSLNEIHDWALTSIGPDANIGEYTREERCKNRHRDSDLLWDYPFSYIYRYSPSNGLISDGDIHKFRIGKPSEYCKEVDGKPGIPEPES
ncbi:MAG: prepilin-type N-terminal cleavage/methylation domain-containing protein [Candidatus Omnitrophota bacterium]